MTDNSSIARRHLRYERDWIPYLSVFSFVRSFIHSFIHSFVSFIHSFFLLSFFLSFFLFFLSFFLSFSNFLSSSVSHFFLRTCYLQSACAVHCGLGHRSPLLLFLLSFFPQFYSSFFFPCFRNFNFVHLFLF